MQNVMSHRFYTFRLCCSRAILRISLLLIALACCALSMAAWTPIIRQFSPQDYAAGTQNWDMLEHTNGWIYVANNYGLLETDGTQWQLYGIHNGTAVRSLALGDDGAIYAGGTDEFGVFRSNGVGELTYENLSTNIPERYRHFGEVWRLQIHDNDLYIQTRHYIFIYNRSGELEVLDPGAIIYESLLWEGNLYIATARDLYIQSGGRLHALRGAEMLHNKVVCGILPFGEKGIIIATDFHGLYTYDGKTIQRFHTEADNYIAENQLYTMAICNQQIALGTVQGGVVFIDEMGRNCKYINRDGGLQNNTILSLLFDSQSNIWMGLDNGIAVSDASNPVLFYRDPQVDYGSGYTSIEYQDCLYLGTNQGLYCLPNNQSSLTMVEGSQGQVWGLAQVGETLFCCHNRGLFIVRNHHLQPLDCSDGAWKICPLSPSTAVVGTYSGFYYLYQSAAGQWLLQYLDGFDETALYFTLDATGAIWILTSRGVERLEIDLQQYKLLPQLVIEQNAAQRIYSLANWKNQVLITSESDCMVVDTNGVVSADTHLLNHLSGKHRYLNIEEDAHHNVWYIYDNRVSMRPYDPQSQSYRNEQILWYSTSQFIGGFTNLTPSSKAGAFVGGVNGFYYMQAAEKQPQQTPSIYIRQIHSLYSPTTILYGESYDGIAHTAVIPASERSLRIRFGCNNAFTETLLFRSRLYPLEENFTPWQPTPYRDFIALPSGGEYTLDIEVLSTSTGEIFTRSLPVQLLYPFYLTWWAKCIYILVFICLLALLVLKINQRVQRSKRQLAEAKNQEIYQQQMRILQLENEKAQFDLRNKSQELSNLLLSEANRKEWNAEVLNEIHHIVNYINADKIPEAKAKIQQLQHRLARNGETAVNWKRFEENFDIVNNQFIARLSKLYPWMSKQERRLCVYIHIGLSSKEIAPLLNISIRAVEMMRYRVRGKMQLDASVSLKQHFRELQLSE